MAAFPGLQQMGKQSPTGAPGLQQQGYSWPGVQFTSGQGQNGFANLSPFESAGASNPESITGGLASGTFGKSASQQPAGGSGSISALALPQLQLPMAQVAAQQASINGDEGGSSGGAAPAGNSGVGLGDIASGASQGLNLANGGGLGTQPTTPGYAQQRAGERTDYTNATGSPSGIPQLAPPSIIPPSQQGVGFGSAQTPALTDVFSGITGGPPQIGAPGLNPSSVGQGIMPGISDVLGGVNAGETLSAPGGSAQFALGTPPSGGGILDTLGAVGQGVVSGAQGVGGLAQVAAGLTGLLGGDSKQYSGALLQLAQGGVQSYQALQQLSAQFPQISEAIGTGALPTVSEGLLKLASGFDSITGANATALVKGIDSFVNGAEGAASGLVGGLSVGGAGAGAVAAILGIIAQQTGSKELGMAAQALGAAASAVATTAAVSGAISAGVTGAVVGGTTAAGAALAPIAALMIASTISGLVGGEDPIGDGINEMMVRGSHYQSFVPELMQNQGQQGQAFSVLQQALPYVQNQEELGRLINSYKNYLQTTTGIQLEDKSGTGDIYSLSAIPGVGPVTHGQQTPSYDWSNQQTETQNIINEMLKELPGQRITSDYAQGGGLSGPENTRLWSQFLDRQRNMPGYEPGYGAWHPANPYGTPGFEGELYSVGYGMPGYGYQGNEATGPLPEPGQYVGQRNPQWDALLQNTYNATPQGQYAQQFTQALQQYQQQLAQLQGQLPQINQAAQQTGGMGLDPALITALQSAPGFSGGNGQFAPNGSSGGGVDLQALLKQLGYIAA